MKKIIFFTMFLTLSATSFSQQTNNGTSMAKQDYLQKSKNQKTLAWILISTGAVSSVTGLIIGNNNFYEEIGSVITTGRDDKNYKTGEFLFYGGFVLMGGSIPLFIAARKNGKRARAISTGFKMENASMLSTKGFTKKSYPAMAFTIKL
ncbi:MAG: hypothetical protein HZB42_14950 [Sphingobacteriales bacterium]|nr:hypothetical protein [Sphingobacteriales bacterium]